MRGNLTIHINLKVFKIIIIKKYFVLLTTVTPRKKENLEGKWREF